MLRRRLTRGACSLVVAGLVAASVVIPGASVSASAADVGPDGFWYFDLYGIQAAHDAGLTGKGITIGVIDTQINLDVPTLQGADIDVQQSTCYDEAGDLIPATSTDVSPDHGTNVVSYLVGSGAGYPGQTGVKGIVPDAKIIFTSSGQERPDNSILCRTSPTSDPTSDGVLSFADPLTTGIYAAIDGGADIISISQGTIFSPISSNAIAYAANMGIPVLAGVPNDALALDGTWPSGANAVVGVQSMDSSAQIQGEGRDGSHADSSTDVVGPGVNLVWQGDGSFEQQRYATGTSLATPITAGFLALVAQKYPNATGNQLIQTLIRNTGAEDHELTYDPDELFGYGTASATHMLRVDPTQYDDSNPLISDDELALPTRDQIENPLPRDLGIDAPWDTNSPTANPEAPPALSSIPILPILLGGIGLLVLLGVITLVIVLATRRGRGTPPA